MGGAVAKAPDATRTSQGEAGAEVGAARTAGKNPYSPASARTLVVRTRTLCMPQSAVYLWTAVQTCDALARRVMRTVKGAFF